MVQPHTTRTHLKIAIISSCERCPTTPTMSAMGRPNAMQKHPMKSGQPLGNSCIVSEGAGYDEG